MRRLSFHLARNGSVHALRTFYSSTMLQSTHQIVRPSYFVSDNRSYRCPTCSRALINMDHYFRLLDVEVRRQPMPAPYDTWQTVILWYSWQTHKLTLATIVPLKVEYRFTLLDTSATCTPKITLTDEQMFKLQHCYVRHLETPRTRCRGPGPVYDSRAGVCWCWRDGFSRRNLGNASLCRCTRCVGHCRRSGSVIVM
jgi:hypothetical protein